MTDAELVDPDRAAFGIDRSDRRLRWTHMARVPWSFRLRRYLASFLLAMMPPFTGRTVFAWLWLPFLVACGWAWVWFVGTQDTGTRDVDSEVRWMGYVFGGILFFVCLVWPSLAAEDAGRRRDPFRSGQTERTAVIGSSFALQRGPKAWVPVRLASIRRVRRLLGVVAIQLPSGKYWTIPSNLFPSRSEWRELMDQTVGYPVI